MSRILDKLKEAEAERQRIVAERKRLEAEADAALAARDMEERMARARAVPRADAPAPPHAGKRGNVERHGETPRPAGNRTRMAIGAALALCLAVGVVVSRQQPKPAPRAVFALKLDRDLESFARRLKENP